MTLFKYIMRDYEIFRICRYGRFEALFHALNSALRDIKR
ncbi:hypothetical protein UFOVP116_278 [uncultured Caudovirales phage]|uniref:Uncharacterized protein n=1 Tax=uncultured Caudovirales phage TaxID=2100421 RepID=A0A6J5LAQ1_9CAUD|nr:hypothetical protein UFOVP116_278 [uncultured Caudovirales phage]